MTENQLAKEVIKHRKLYNIGEPEISDAAFDKLEQQLREVNPKHPALNRMESPIDKANHKLPVPLPSLNKVRPDMGADKWLKAHSGPFVVSDKLDGLSAEIVYDPKKPTKAYSSGDDGLHGKDISHLLSYMSIPQSLKKSMVVRVELIMSKADFQQHWAKEFKNARNLATGIKNKTTGIHKAAKHYKAVALAVLEPRMKPSAAFVQLKAMGFLTAPNKVYPTLTVGQLEKLFAARKKSSPYDVDGVVIEQDKITKAPKDNPEHQVAFKDILGIETAEVTVIKVTWEDSRMGRLTPRIWFDPVRLSGVDISKVTGHNAAVIYNGKIGPGAVIKISRRGDVIPTLEEVIKPAKQWSVPPGREDKDWAWNESGVDIFIHKDLSGSDKQRIRSLVHFFTNLGVDGYREGTATNLYNAGFDTVLKLMETSGEEYADVIGKVNSAKLANSIDENCFEVYPADLAYAWGGFDRGIGSKTTWAVWTEVGNKGMKALSKGNQLASIKVFQPIVGPVAAKGLAEKLKEFYVFAESIGTKLIEYVPEKVTLKSKKLQNQVILFTGFRDADLKTDIEQNGGTTVDGMSSNVTVLLVKELDSTSSKTQKAKQMGIPIMTAMGFRSKFKV